MANAFSLKTKLTTPRFEETRDSYRDLFGLELHEEWDAPFDRGCILGVTGPDSQALLEIYYAPAESDFGGLSLQFRVENLSNFSIPDDPRFAFRGPVARPWGSRYLFLTDPNGISVVIFSGTSL